MIILIAKDKYQNMAIIEKCRVYGHMEAKERTTSYRLSIYDEGDNNFLFYVRMYESLEEARDTLKIFSCDEWEIIFEK